jgi:hypothetical protein
LSNILSFEKWFKKKKPESKIIIRTPYARAGETITCTEGHPIADFQRDIYFGDWQDVENDIGNWRQDKIPPGTHPIPGCAVCGASFCVGSIYHFADGWRGWSVDNS